MNSPPYKTRYQARLRDSASVIVPDKGIDVHRKPLVFDNPSPRTSRRRRRSAQQCSTQSRQTVEVNSPDIHHSAGRQDTHGIRNTCGPSNGRCTSPQCSHSNRDSNTLPNFERSRNPHLDLPKAGDHKSWKALDLELSDGLRLVFYPRGKLDRLPVSELCAKIDTWLYTFLKGKFGCVEPRSRPRGPVKQWEHKGMRRLRARKQYLRSARRRLKARGLERSPEGLLLSKQWFRVVRQHNALRKALLKRGRTQKEARARARFRKNPMVFAKNLFKEKQARGDPTFSKEEAEEYFFRTYADEDRAHCYEPLKGMVRPELPSQLFATKAPTLSELRRSALRKSNRATPGVNGIPYIVYKRCPSVLLLLHKLVRRIWKVGSVPDDWAVAFVILLAKSEQLGVPSEFRPIAIGNTAGKILFSVVSDRLQRFLVDNAYLKRNVQKGFLTGVAGCIDHSFALAEALKEAKQEQRAIVTTWIDLANAYGSVRHNLIQFSLNWYHVPLFIQKLIFDYYERLRAFVTTSKWTTGFFLFDIGLFQGCVLSTILFDCVFNLMLDFLAPLHRLGFQLKCGVRTMEKAYADDLNITTKRADDNQKVLDRMCAWLTWTVTMRAKPKKCLHLAFRRFPPGDSRRFTPLLDKSYSPYDAQLIIADKPVRCLLNVDSMGGFFNDHFKFLGRWLRSDLSEKEVKVKVTNEYWDRIAMVATSGVNGFMKLWLYQFSVLPFVTWPFLIHDLDLSFVEALCTETNDVLRGWAGLHFATDAGCLYRSKESFGLGLTSLVCHYKQLQVIKCHLLKHSPDPDICATYAARAKKESVFVRVRRASRLLSTVEPIVDFQCRFQGQSDRLGIGHQRYAATHSVAARRKKCGRTVKALENDAWVNHALKLSWQGAWLQWCEHVNPFNLSWQNLIYGPGPGLISFVLNATINHNVTPSLLKLWGHVDEAVCKLCGKSPCTLHHIISHCDHALRGKRFTWRHDSVLKTLQPVLNSHLQKHNASAPRRRRPIAFVRAGEKTCRPPAAPPPARSLLTDARDWELLVDFDSENIVFPPAICATAERPDIIIWSTSLKKVILIELTCPAEEGILAARIRKQARYHKALIPLIETTAWKVELLTIEAGARGFVSYSFRSVLRKIGFPSRTATSICKVVSEVCARCTYAIWLARDTSAWKADRALLALPV